MGDKERDTVYDMRGGKEGRGERMREENVYCMHETFVKRRKKRSSVVSCKCLFVPFLSCLMQSRHHDDHCEVEARKRVDRFNHQEDQHISVEVLVKRQQNGGRGEAMKGKVFSFPSIERIGKRRLSLPLTLSMLRIT